MAELRCAKATHPIRPLHCSAGLPDLMQNRRDVLPELRRMLAHRKVPELLHDRHLRTRNASRRAQRVLGRAGKVVLAGQEIKRASSSDGR